MRIDRSVWLTSIAAIAAGLLVFPFLPGDWPSPLREGTELRAVDLLQLKMAAARVDLACNRGDVAGFALSVTTAHHRRLTRQLAVIDRALDAEALQQFGSEREFQFADLLRRPVLASEIRGERAVIAIGRPDGAGAQVLAFVWDGRKLRLDDSHHAIAAADRARARVVVRDAVAARR